MKGLANIKNISSLNPLEKLRISNNDLLYILNLSSLILKEGVVIDTVKNQLNALGNNSLFNLNQIHIILTGYK